jgi:hypothetical protein
LAILLILTALLLPKLSRIFQKPAVVFQTVDQGRVTQVSASIQGLETAIVSHLNTSPTLNSSGGTKLTFSDHYDSFGQVLLREGLLERPFSTALGTNSFVRLTAGSGLSGATPISPGNGAYDLDGEGHNDVVNCQYVVEAVICGLSEAEASAIDNQIDGPGLSGRTRSADLVGRVIYTKTDAGQCEVHVYLARK